MVLALLLTQLAFGQAALEDAFVKPSPALANSKYLKDCGGELPDLRPEMPPVDTQGLAGWCSTFTARALLEHFYQRGRTEKNDRFSVMDINSLNAQRPPEQYGRIPDLDPQAGANNFLLLEGVQRMGQLYRDEDYRYDQRYFDATGRIGRLSAYYDRQSMYGGDPEALACRDQSPELVGVEQQFTGIENMLSYLDKGDFLTAVGKKFMILPAPKAGAKRENLIPPFNIRRVVPTTGDQYVEELKQNLLNHRPISIGICSNQMRQLPGLGWGAPLTPNDKLTCGGHALVVVGMKNIDGQCQVEVRNSWGAWWPKPAAGGYGWIPLKDFLKVQMVGADMASLSPRAEGAPIWNHIETGNGRYYEGRTVNSMLEGQGKMLGSIGLDEGEFKGGFLVKGKRTETDGGVFEGQFANGVFYAGHMKGKLSDGALYDGEFSNGALNGQGTLKDTYGSVSVGQFAGGWLVNGTRTDADGSVYSGQFNAGSLFNGHIKGKLTSGAIYDGDYTDGTLTGHGKIVFPNGTTFEGRLEDGRYMDGYFSGLLDSKRGIYYTGTLKGGASQPDGKFTDKNGKPWVWK